nr:aldehyde dehydrogenase family protein [Halomicroarcula sp. SHR3]
MDVTQTERRVRPVVAGERRDGSGSTDVVDRTTDEVFATVATGDATTLASAVAAASGAVPTDLETAVIQRANWSGAIASGIRDRSDELADALVREAGVPITSARDEAATAARQFDRVADVLRSLTGAYRTWTTARGPGTTPRRRGPARSRAVSSVRSSPAGDSGSAARARPRRRQRRRGDGPGSDAGRRVDTDRTRPRTRPRGAVGFVPLVAEADGHARTVSRGPTPYRRRGFGGPSVCWTMR